MRLCGAEAEAERMRKEEGQRNGDSFCLENMSAIWGELLTLFPADMHSSLHHLLETNWVWVAGFVEESKSDGSKHRSVKKSAIEANDELRAAIKRGDLEAVDRALQSGVSPNSAIDCEDAGKRRSYSLLNLGAKVRVLKWNVSFYLLYLFDFGRYSIPNSGAK